MMLSSLIVCLFLLECPDGFGIGPKTTNEQGLDPVRPLETADVQKSGFRKVYTFYRDRDGNEILHGNYVTYRKDGTKSSEMSYKDGKLDGECRDWSLSGQQLLRLARYEMGVAVGKSTTWWEAGDSTFKESEIDWEEGKVAKKRYYFSGLRAGHKDAEGQVKVSSETLYRNGRESSYTQWHASDKKAVEGAYDEHGSRHGVWVFYAKDGTICAQGEWQHGRPWNGVCLDFNKDAIGSLQMKIFCRYKDGTVIEKDLRICLDH